MGDISEEFARGAFKLETLLQNLDSEKKTQCFESALLKFCSTNAIDELNIDSKKLITGNKIVTRTNQGTILRALPVYDKHLINRCTSGSPSYRREGDGLLHHNPALAELVVPSILGSVDHRFVPKTLCYEFEYVDKWIYVFIVSECRGKNTLDKFVFDPRNSYDEAEFSRKMDGIVLQIIFALYQYQKAANFTHSDLHTKNVVFREATSARELEVTIDKKTKTFYVDEDVPEISLIDFEFSIATGFIGAKAERGTSYAVFGNEKSMEWNYDNSYDCFRLLTCLANTELDRVFSGPIEEGKFSRFLETTIKHACSPAAYYENNWHSKNHKKIINRNLRDFPIHNANLMYYPITPRSILRAEDAFSNISHDTKIVNCRVDDDGDGCYVYSLYAEKENFMYSKRVPALPWNKFKPLTTFENEALVDFAESMRREIQEILYRFIADEKTLKRAVWRKCIHAQRVIFLFYKYTDQTDRGTRAKNKDDVLTILHAFSFLARRTRRHYDGGVALVKLEDLTRMLKQTYVENQTARVPIELVDPRKAMAADRETWLRVPDMSRDRLAYSTATTTEDATNFFFNT